MKPIVRQFIDWQKTGRNLQLLREDNIELRKFVCHAKKQEAGGCLGNCNTCRFEMENRVSRKAIAELFGVSESVVFNWESGRTAVPLEDILFYVHIAGLQLDNVLVFC